MANSCKFPQKPHAKYAEVSDKLWMTCRECGDMIYSKKFHSNSKVCPSCGYYAAMTPVERFELLFDGAKFETIEMPIPSDDPLKFTDKVSYADRLKKYRKSTGEQDVVQTAVGKIDGVETVVLCFNFAFMGGSMGRAVGEGIMKAAGEALARKAPFVLIPASGGARMQEGINSLMQMPRTLMAIEDLKNAGLPYIVVLTNPTTGGVTASFAMVGDVHIAEKGAVIAFAGRRVIEGTIGEKLPDDFQTAEYLREHGMVDIVVERSELKSTLGNVLSLLTNVKKK